MSIPGDLGLALRTASSGLASHQRALNAVANNIANVNTEGYTRRAVELRQRVVGGAGGGVELAALGRQVDENMLAATRREMSALYAAKISADFNARIQAQFGTPESSGSLAHALSRLQSSAETLAAAPEGSIEQRDLMSAAVEASIGINRLSATIQSLRLEADQRLDQGVTEAENLLQNVAALNERIVRDTYNGVSNNDVRDERDRALDRLSQLMEIRAITRPRADALVFTADGRTLIDDEPSRLSHDAAASLGANSTYAEGDLAGIYIGVADETNDITEKLGGGELAGLVELRDRTLPDLQSALDELAHRLRLVVNEAHNRGVPYPGMSRADGSRDLVDPQRQTVSFAGGDTMLALIDGTGLQSSAISINAMMSAAGFVSPWTIDELAIGMQAWLRANGAPAATASAASGRMVLDLGASDLRFGFRDQVDGAPGSARADTGIAFDADGDGIVDETVSGFSNFFGLNDLFIDPRANSSQQSQVMSVGYRASADAQLTFIDAAGWSGAAVVAAGASLRDIAAAITEQTGLVATVVPDGTGERLRISSQDGRAIAIAAATGSVLSDLELRTGQSGLAGAMHVRSDIAADPGALASAVLQYDPGAGVSGAYVVGVGDPTAINEMAEALSAGMLFGYAGGQGEMLVTAAEYAAQIIGGAAVEAESVSKQVVFQETLVEDLAYKSKSLSGVNLDQEVSDLMIYEQAYSASARVISVIQKMFEALDAAVR